MSNADIALSEPFPLDPDPVPVKAADVLTFHAAPVPFSLFDLPFGNIKNRPNRVVLTFYRDTDQPGEALEQFQTALAANAWEWLACRVEEARRQSDREASV